MRAGPEPGATDWAGTRGQWEVAVRSHPGRVRMHNEDTWACAPDRNLFAVVDGMGGEQAGEVAAAMVRDALLEVSDPEAALVLANRRVRERGRQSPTERGMGAVATAVRVEGPEAEVFHVGDTRAYLASAGGCVQLTRDHTAVAEVRDRLGLTEVEAQALGPAHAVTRDVGREDDPGDDWVHRARTRFEPGDILLLCSDGLHDMVPHRDLVARLARARREREPVARLVDDLLDRALAQGGKDNVTILLVRRRAPPPPWLNPLLGVATGVLLGVLAGLLLLPVPGEGP